MLKEKKEAKVRYLKILTLVSVLLPVLLSGCNHHEKWGWKRSQTPTDMMNFLNGTDAYNYPTKKARVCAVRKPGYKDFIAFYQFAESKQPKGNWGWKLATDVDDAHNFINGLGAYQYPVRDAQIGLMWESSYPAYYIFYVGGTADDNSGSWGWKSAPTPEDALNFLNGRGAYNTPIKNARIAAKNNNYSEFIIFYQSATNEGPPGNWGFKKSTDPDDVKKFLSGEGAYSNSVKEAEICSFTKGSYTEYYVFYK
jgi:hypothetical protein